MSAILSSDDLNDFISPGVACIKPVETLSAHNGESDAIKYEVTTEDKVPSDSPPAHISLTDCLACSGCVTSAEAVLISLQSHAEVLSTLDAEPGISHSALRHFQQGGTASSSSRLPDTGKIFVASLSPQVCASLAATYGISAREAGHMVEQLLAGPQGLAAGGSFGNRFAWIIDTNAMRQLGLVMATEEVTRCQSAPQDAPKKPILTSACPGWVCYAEKEHPYVLPHLSRLKSPQALTGTLLKTVLSKSLGIDPGRIWHLAIMPCFDKKLEASRQELTDAFWQPTAEAAQEAKSPVRDVDCVITARELLMLADSRGISFPTLPRTPLDASSNLPFPDTTTSSFLFSQTPHSTSQPPESGPSGGFLYHNLCTQQSLHPGSNIKTQRGRNADIVEYSVEREDQVLFRAARYYGFRNIQNLVRRLKPARASRMPTGRAGAVRKPNANPTGQELEYVEVMACPGGCTNGGGQIKLQDLEDLQGAHRVPETQKQWLSLVDEAYFSMDEETSPAADDAMALDGDARGNYVNGISTQRVHDFLQHWSTFTGIGVDRLVCTSFREVESDVGKKKSTGTERVAEIAGRIGGGW